MSRNPRIGIRLSAWRLAGLDGARGVPGFTMVETLVVVSIIGLALAISTPAIGTALANAKADAGMRQLLGELREARDNAMTQRRTIEVQFLGTNEIRTIRIDGSTRTTLSDVLFENKMQYVLQTGLPDTPDAFGNSTAVCFGGLTTVWFLVDGSLVDSSGVPLSGSVFLGQSGKPLTARAVTVLGPTGRTQSYEWDGSSWR
jgi:prepilin-type N-terminal cleavage/methylation domain-containing protein